MKRVHSTDAYLTITIAALAFLLSYTKLVDLALRAGYGDYAAHVWPLIVDGITIVATRGVLRLTGSRRYAWTLLAAGTGVSMTAAVGSQLLPPGPLPPSQPRPCRWCHRSAYWSHHTSRCNLPATRRRDLVVT